MTAVNSSIAEKPSVGAQVVGGLKWAFSAPVIVAIVTAGLTATIVPLLTREWQNHEKRLNLKTAIAIDMSRSSANAIGAGRRVGTGVVYAVTANPRENKAVIQDAYNRGFGQWQVDRGRLSAQLFARFHDNEIVGDWRRFATTVGSYYRLGAVIPRRDRNHLVEQLSTYLTSELRPLDERKRMWETRWQHLKGRPAAGERSKLTREDFYAKQNAFRNDYIYVADTLLRLGEQLVERLLNLNPKV